MNRKANGQIRRGQVIMTYGPGALIDLPKHSAIVGGLDEWPKEGSLDRVIEPRLARKLSILTGVTAPRLYSPPVDSGEPGAKPTGIRAWRFPEWFVVHDEMRGTGGVRSRRLVRLRNLDDNRSTFEGRAAVPTRFVCGCPLGHVDDVDWWAYVHVTGGPCSRPLWLDERGTSGDLADLSVRCECGQRKGLDIATNYSAYPMGRCSGARPWLGKNARQSCEEPSRLLIRTASNAYFPQVVSVLSLPDRKDAIGKAVADCWGDLEIVETSEHLALMKRKPGIAQALEGLSDADVLAAIEEMRAGNGSERPVKEVELDALLGAPEGFGDDVPVDPNFHARRLPRVAWASSMVSDAIEAVVQVHRLREVLALAGFTRFEAVTPDIQGEYETDVQRADLAIEPKWFPAVENRGEGVFVQLRPALVRAWLARDGVKRRIKDLEAGHAQWAIDRKSKRSHPGGPYVLLHTLSHLLLQSISMRCGYPASSIRERVYSDEAHDRFGILVYTGSPDAEGTLGGLVNEARHIDDHLAHALRCSSLCSNDPICAQHSPRGSLEGRWLHGAACHGCVFVAETSCEMRNDYLDRALLVPTVAVPDAAFLEGTA